MSEKEQQNKAQNIELKNNKEQKAMEQKIKPKVASLKKLIKLRFV